jgi:hypothetical protein
MYNKNDFVFHKRNIHIYKKLPIVFQKLIFTYYKKNVRSK